MSCVTVLRALSTFEKAAKAQTPVRGPRCWMRGWSQGGWLRPCPAGPDARACNTCALKRRWSVAHFLSRSPMRSCMRCCSSTDIEEATPTIAGTASPRSASSIGLTRPSMPVSSLSSTPPPLPLPPKSAFGRSLSRPSTRSRRERASASAFRKAARAARLSADTASASARTSFKVAFDSASWRWAASVSACACMILWLAEASCSFCFLRSLRSNSSCSSRSNSNSASCAAWKPPNCTSKRSTSTRRHSERRSEEQALVEASSFSS
mmetsp:Transcript_978/g.2102  ORF Transcript_978/g.2102 Transcript_978/m.2102 type:complete len:265 (-) Transcript_978:1635-2429(-)